MIFFVDKIINYIFIVFILHYGWRLQFRDNKICKISSLLITLVVGALDAYKKEDTFIIYYIWLIVIAFLLFKDKLIHIWILTSVLMVFMGMLDTFSINAMRVLFFEGIIDSGNLEWWKMPAYCLSFLFYYFTYKFLLKKKNVFLDEIKMVYKISLLLMTLLFEMIVVHVFSVYYKQNCIYDFALNIRFMICLIGAIYAIEITLQLAINNFLVEKRNKELQIAFNIQQNQFIYQKEKTEDLRRFRHDLINHIGAIQELLFEKNYERAEEYINKIWSVTEKLSSGIKIGNDYIDAVLNYYAYCCEKEKIDYEIQGRLVKESDIEPVDIISLLGNALQNAYEATLQQDKRIIKVVIKDSLDELYFAITNTCDNQNKKKDYYLETTKNDKKNHGIGLKNIERIVKKYKGQLYIKNYEENAISYFKLEIALSRSLNDYRNIR